MSRVHSVAVQEREERTMDRLIKFLSMTAPFQGDLDYRLIRASMVIIYFFFGYQKWFDYEAQGLIPTTSTPGRCRRDTRAAHPSLAARNRKAAARAPSEITPRRRVQDL